jgi:hypothetical protein
MMKIVEKQQLRMEQQQSRMEEQQLRMEARMDKQLNLLNNMFERLALTRLMNTTCQPPASVPSTTTNITNCSRPTISNATAASTSSTTSTARINNAASTPTPSDEYKDSMNISEVDSDVPFTQVAYKRGRTTRSSATSPEGEEPPAKITKTKKKATTSKTNRQ